MRAADQPHVVGFPGPRDEPRRVALPLGPQIGRPPHAGTVRSRRASRSSSLVPGRPSERGEIGPEPVLGDVGSAVLRGEDRPRIAARRARADAAPRPTEVAVVLVRHRVNVAAPSIARPTSSSSRQNAAASSGSSSASARRRGGPATSRSTSPAGYPPAAGARRSPPRGRTWRHAASHRASRRCTSGSRRRRASRRTTRPTPSRRA